MHVPASQPLSDNEFLVAFEKQNADETRGLIIQRNHRIFNEAQQQIEKMLQRITDAPAIALNILSGLERIQMVLLSCTTVLAEQHLSAEANWWKSSKWTEKEENDFCCKFTRCVPGTWNPRDVLGSWEELVKVLIDNKHMGRFGETPSAVSDPFSRAEIATKPVKASGLLRNGSEQLMTSRGKSAVCFMSVLERENDFDNYDYEKALGVLDYQNKYRILKAKEMEKEERPGVVIRLELQNLEMELNERPGQ